MSMIEVEAFHDRRSCRVSRRFYCGCMKSMLAHITLATRDVPRSVAFFQETLGWLPVGRPANITMAAAWLTIEPGLELHLIEDPEFEPSRFEREFGRHIAVTFPRVEFPQLKERLQTRGAVLIEPLR